MKKISEYRQHADECRTLLKGLNSGEHRERLVEMARTWDTLAEERATLLKRHPELAQDAAELAEAGVGPRPIVPSVERSGVNRGGGT